MITPVFLAVLSVAAESWAAVLGQWIMRKTGIAERVAVRRCAKTDRVAGEVSVATNPTFTPDLQRAYDREVREVRGRAAEVLAAIGPDRLRRVALFRACRWADLSALDDDRDRRSADLAWLRAAEWLRIWLALGTGDVHLPVSAPEI